MLQFFTITNNFVTGLTGFQWFTFSDSPPENSPPKLFAPRIIRLPKIFSTLLSIRPRKITTEIFLMRLSDDEKWMYLMINKKWEKCKLSFLKSLNIKPSFSKLQISWIFLKYIRVRLNCWFWDHIYFIKKKVGTYRKKQWALYTSSRLLNYRITLSKDQKLKQKYSQLWGVK